MTRNLLAWLVDLTGRWCPHPDCNYLGRRPNSLARHKTTTHPRSTP